MGMVGPRVSKAFDEHLAIINAIENHDGELAEMLMKRHISASQANIQTKFDVYQSIWVFEQFNWLNRSITLLRIFYLEPLNIEIIA